MATITPDQSEWYTEHYLYYTDLSVPVKPGEGMVNSPFAKLSPEIRLMIYEEAMLLDKKYSYHETPPLLQTCSLIRREARTPFLSRVNSVRVPITVKSNSDFRLAGHEKKRLLELPSKTIGKLERIDLIVQYDTSGHYPLAESSYHYYRRTKTKHHKLVKSIELSVRSDGRCQYIASSRETALRYYSSPWYLPLEHHSGGSILWIPHMSFAQYDWAKSDISKLIDVVEQTANLFQPHEEAVMEEVYHDLTNMVEAVTPSERDTFHDFLHTMSRSATELQRARQGGTIDQEEIVVGEAFKSIQRFQISFDQRRAMALRQLSEKHEWYIR